MSETETKTETWKTLIQTLSVGDQLKEFANPLTQMVITGLINPNDSVTTRKIQQLILDEKEAADRVVKQMEAQIRNTPDSPAPTKNGDSDQDETVELPQLENPRLLQFLSEIIVYIERYSAKKRRDKNIPDIVLESSEMYALRKYLYHMFNTFTS